MTTTYYTRKSVFHFVTMLSLGAVFAWITLKQVRAVASVVVGVSAGTPVPSGWHWLDELLSLVVCIAGTLVFLRSLLLVRTTVFTNRYVGRRGLFKQHRMYWQEVVSVVEDGTSIVLQSRHDRLRFSFLHFPDSEQLGEIVRRHVAPEAFRQGGEEAQGATGASTVASAAEVAGGSRRSTGDTRASVAAGGNMGHSPPLPTRRRQVEGGARGTRAPPNVLREDVSFVFFLRMLAVALALVVAIEALAALGLRIGFGADPSAAALWLAGGTATLLVLLPRRYWLRILMFVVGGAGVVVVVTIMRAH